MTVQSRGHVGFVISVPSRCWQSLLVFWESGTVVSLLGSSIFFFICSSFIFSETLSNRLSLTWTNSSSRLILNLRPESLSFLTSRDIGLYHRAYNDSLGFHLQMNFPIFFWPISELTCSFINLSLYADMRT